MTTFVATIVIDVEDGEDAREQALTVLAERLSHDEDYGFPYTVRHEHNLAERDEPAYVVPHNAGGTVYCSRDGVVPEQDSGGCRLCDERGDSYTSA